MPKVRRQVQRKRAKKAGVDLRPVREHAPSLRRSPAVTFPLLFKVNDTDLAKMILAEQNMEPGVIRPIDTIVGRKLYFVTELGNSYELLVHGAYTTHNAALHAASRVARFGGGAGGRASFEITWMRVIA